jgi:hypothetical protein
VLSLKSSVNEHQSTSTLFKADHKNTEKAHQLGNTGWFYGATTRDRRATSITRPPSSLTEGRTYVTGGVRLAQRPRRGASRRLR